jgi:hypothetical protein
MPTPLSLPLVGCLLSFRCASAEEAFGELSCNARYCSLQSGQSKRRAGIFVTGWRPRESLTAARHGESDMASVQKVRLSPSRDIPFNKLVLSQSNVRRVKAGVSIERSTSPDYR